MTTILLLALLGAFSLVFYIRERIIMSALSDLQAAVAANQSAVTAAVAVMATLVPPNDADLQAATAAVTAATNELNAATAAKTSAP